MSTTAPTAPVTSVPRLNLGTILSKGLGSTSSFLDVDADTDEEGQPFIVSADAIATGRTCVIGSSGCIPEDEFFYTRNGVVKVSEVYEGMPSHNGYISRVQKKIDKIYNVVLHSSVRGTIRFVASGEHPILVSLPCNRGLIRGKIPKKGKHFGHKYHEHQRWVTVRELFERQYRFAYGRVEDAQIIDVNTISIGKELARLLGYLMSDGSWSLNQSVKFTNVREEFLQDVEALAHNFGLVTKRYHNGNGFNITITHQNGHNRYGDHLLLDSIINLEIASHSDTFGKIQLLEQTELVEFLKGYFNGDGNLRFVHPLRNRPFVQMTFYVGISQRQAIELQFMLWRLGIYSSIKYRSRRNGEKGCWEVVVSPSSTKLAVKLLRDIKYPKVFDKAIALDDIPLRNNLGLFYQDDKNWMKIKKVEYLRETIVVGWETNPDHLILSYGGLVTHNSGKSYSVGVICEELCKNKVPFVIIDIEGEYSGLKEKYEAIWIGEEDNCDLKWSSGKVNLRLLARYAPDGPPLILDLSEADKPRDKVGLFLLSIYREISKRRTPYLVVLEEADRFAPQSGDRLQIFDEVARRGRKRGLGLMLCTQRPSLVDKNILSQCANQLIGKLVIKNDLNSVSQFFPGRGTPNQLTSLSAGEFYALGGLAVEPIRVKMRARETRHGGMTPKLNPRVILPSIQNVISALESESTTVEIQAPPAPTVAHQTPSKQPSLDLGELEEEQEHEGDEKEQEHVAATPPAQVKPSGPRLLGLSPRIDQTQVPNLIRVEKSHKFFGQRETIASVNLRFRPLIEVGVRTRTGIIKKKFETMYFLLDGLSGQLFEPSDRLSFRYGLERLIGLEEGHLLVLKVLHPDKDMSIVEIASQSKIPEDQVRRLLKGLEDQRLVRSSKLGRIKIYRRILDLPSIELTKQPSLELVELNANSSDGNPTGLLGIQETRIKEAHVREIVKGMWEGTDVESFQIFYYPVYLVQLILNSSTRTVTIDGRTGAELNSLP
jgi:predicted transcriptional regulator